MGRIKNININTGVIGSKQISFFEYKTEILIDNIQKEQFNDLKKKYEIVAEDGTYISNTLCYDNIKMEKYLLNLNHPQGYSKAKFLNDVLNYRNGDGVKLYYKIRKALIGTYPEKITKTINGIKQEYNIKLEAKNGTTVNVNVVIIVQKDNGKSTYRIITLYPRKKGI